MKLIKQSLLSCAIIFAAFSLNAQNATTTNWCGTDQHTQDQYAKNPALIQQNAIMDQYIEDHRKDIIASMGNKKAIIYTIPVVWHVVTYNGAGNVNKADIDDQMLRLNEDFQRLNSDASSTRALFAPYAVDVQVQFRLAHKDPNGNCTEGIVRLESPLALDADDDIKALSYWDSKKYFNIWTCITMASDNPPSITLGYAQFPTSGINSTYGVVMRSSYIGRNQRTLTHEVGHCFGLYHTFQSSCGNNCSNSGDRCCDTPPASTSTQGCDLNQNTCTNDANGPDPFGTNVVDQIENYMSYDACQNMFSDDQKIRMHAYLSSTSISQGLYQLTTTGPTGNLNFTGTEDPYGPVICSPIADFSYNKDFICEGDSVTFTDQSYNATPTAWNWTFTGGSPASSAASSPTITYNNPGTFTVTSQPSTTAGAGNATKTNIITVSSLTADYVGPIVDGFENTSQYALDWRVENVNNGVQTWANNNIASTTGSRSVRIRNYFNDAGEIHELISPSYDLSSFASKSITFKQAYAKRSATDNDRLLIYVSTTCGATWSLKMPITAATLATAPDHTVPFVPTSSEWVQRTLDLTFLGAAPNARIKFAFTSGDGNDIYIDDININGTVGIDEFANIGSFNVYPNPTNSSAKIAFHLLQNVKNLNVVVRNAVGQVATNVILNQAFEQGKYTLSIDDNRSLSSGIYFVEFNADGVIKTQKLIVQ